jgi:hypothetical protein
LVWFVSGAVLMLCFWRATTRLLAYAQKHNRRRMEDIFHEHLFGRYPARTRDLVSFRFLFSPVGDIDPEMRRLKRSLRWTWILAIAVPVGLWLIIATMMFTIGVGGGR